ncbi:MAG: DUF362 domain-containing protein [Deltaproteobacteria bacterium]|nr:DUF362 domain-containing protein [Deltaproteobacteria bacterium]
MTMGRESRVYFADMRTTVKKNLFDKIELLLERVGTAERFRKGELVAIKLHFGEKGNASYIRPVFVRCVVDMIKKTGAMPFLTDTNTLYVGTRSNSVSHLRTAIENGFDYAVTNAPLIIADGLRGEAKERIGIDGRHFKEAVIAREIVSADGLVALTHFKCHEICGFGGALKNIGMGSAAREGKLAQHSKSAPKVDPANCTACSECALNCPADAIQIGVSAVINPELCIGCGQCIAVCPEGTIKIVWNETYNNVQEKMAEYALAALKGKEKKALFLNFIKDVSPSCDCYGHNDAPIVPDIGILASTDPVAIDQASADLVNSEEGLKNSALTSGIKKGGDKFRGVHPDVDWQAQLKHAEKIGLGAREYKLIEV